MGGFCKCCTGDCSCGTVTPPTITITGYTAAGSWSSVSDCCKYIMYEPDESDLTRCCATLLEKTWEQICELKAWAQNLPIGIDVPGICPPDPAKFCTPDPPLTHIGTVTNTYNELQKIFFIVEYDKPRIEVWFGKDNFTCGGVTECKWFLKVRWCFEVQVEYAWQYGWQATRTTAAVHPCFATDNHYDGTWESPNWPDVECSTDRTSCSGDAYTVCFDRIKIWDELPANGPISFTDTDIGSECEVKPSCASIVFDDSSHCFTSASFGVCELCWDYEIIEDTVTYEFGGEVISSYNSFGSCDFECSPIATNCVGNTTTCPTVTQTLPCHYVEFGDSEACCGTTSNNFTVDPVDGTFGRCDSVVDRPFDPPQSCGFFIDVVAVPYFTNEATCGVPTFTPCDSTCCYYFDCGDCSQCKHKFAGGFGVFYGSQEITINTTCDPPGSGECCISLGTRTINVVWA